MNNHHNTADAGYEHRDLRPAAPCGHNDEKNQPPVRVERAVNLSFRSADITNTPPPNATAPSSEPQVTEPQQTVEKSGGRSQRATRHIEIGDGDHLVVFAEGDVVVRSERSGANFDELGTISIEEAAAAVFSARNDWPQDLREAVIVRLLRMKWGTGIKEMR